MTSHHENYQPISPEAPEQDLVQNGQFLLKVSSLGALRKLLGRIWSKMDNFGLKCPLWELSGSSRSISVHFSSPGKLLLAFLFIFPLRGSFYSISVHFSSLGKLFIAFLLIFPFWESFLEAFLFIFPLWGSFL